MNEALQPEPEPFGTSNPLYERLQRRAGRRPWWIASAVLGLGLGLAQNLPYLITPRAYIPSRNGGIPFYFFLIGTLQQVVAVSTFLLPILVAAISAASTARETANDSYDLILLTDLSNIQIVRAYLRNAVRRTRPLWAAQIGLTVPSLIFALNRPFFFGGIRYFGSSNIGRAFIVLLLQMSGYLPSLLLRLPWLMLAVLCGVWLAQRLRSVLGAMLAALIALFVGQFAYMLLSVYLLSNVYVPVRLYTSNGANGATSVYTRSLSDPDIGYSLLAIVVALLVPFVAWLLFIRLPAHVRRRM